MFKKEIDKNDRKAMINFLSKHFRYNTMNSWNRSTSYANDVKINNIGLDHESTLKAYDFLSAECPEFDDDYYCLKQEFEAKTGYSVRTNGRSGGYLVLYETGTNKMGKPCVYFGRSIDQNEDFDEWSDEMLKERVKLVTCFDEFCDDVINLFKDYVQKSSIKTVEYTVTKTKVIAEIPE